MSKKQFNAVKNECNLEGGNNVLIDSINSYPISIVLINNLVQIRFELPERIYNWIMPDFENDLLSLGFKKTSYKNEVMILNYANNQDAVKMYNELKTRIASKISNHTNELICPYCNNNGCDTLILKNNQYLAVHEHCHKDYLKTLENIEENGTIFEYLKGGIGALVGAMLPMLLALVLIILINTSFGWLYVLSATGAITGYRFMKGGYGKKASVILLLSCIIAFIIFMYATSIYWVNDAGYASFYSFADQISLINELIFSSDFFELFGFESIFFIIGMIIIIAQKPFSKKKILKDQNAIEIYTRLM